MTTSTLDRISAEHLGAATALKLPAQHRSSGRRQMLRIRADNRSFVLDTKYVDGFFDLSRGAEQVEQAIAESGLSDRVCSLSKLLSTAGSATREATSSEDPERVLISVRHPQLSGGLRVQQMSGIIDLPQHAFAPLASIARPAGLGDVLAESAIMEPESLGYEPAKNSLSLVVDPLEALRIACHLGSGPNESHCAPAARFPLGPELGHERTLPSTQVLIFSHLSATATEATDIEFLFCLPLACVAEVISIRETLPLPYPCRYCEGHVLWRQQAVPIVRLDSLFEGKDKPVHLDHREHQRKRRLIVAYVGQQPVGLLTNSLMQTMKSPAGVRKQAPQQLSQAPVLGCFETELGDVLVPDLDRILRGDF